MSGPNEHFAAHTRSATFALTLPDRQIAYLLAHAKTLELAAKYPWYLETTSINFGEPEDVAALHTTGTVRALVRRGLVVVAPVELPCNEVDIVKLTRAGELVVELLGEAGFQVDPRAVRSVHLHPDDRTKLTWTDSLDMQVGETPPDRRDPADAPYLSSPHRGAGRPAPVTS